jgi:hypothetical protein
MFRNRRGERGQSLVIVLSLITLMFLLGSALAVHASVALRATRATEAHADDFYAADAATELGIWWQRNGKAGNPPAQTINGITTSTTITTAGGGGGSCPADITARWMSGFESGVIHRVAPTNNSLAGGFAAVQSGAAGIVDAVASPARTGGFSMRIAPNSAAGNYAYLEAPNGVTLGNWQVVHVAIRFGALPTKEANVISLTPVSASGWAHPAGYLYYKPSTGKWAVGLGSSSITVSQESSVSVALDTWYSFDLRMQVIGTNTRMLEWFIDGVAQPTASVVDSAGSGSGPRVAFGQYVLTSPNYGSAYTAYFDDVVISTTSADYPIGDIKITPLLPNGIHADPLSYLGFFQDDDSTAVDALSYQRTDEVPMTPTTDWIKQITSSGGGYVGIDFADTTETCIRGASIVAGMKAQSGAPSAALGTNYLGPATGANNTVWSSASGPALPTTLAYAQEALTTSCCPSSPGVGPWTQAGVNAAWGLFGYCINATSTRRPELHSMILELAYRPISGGPATVTIVGTGGASTATTTYPDAGAGVPSLSTWTVTK